MGFSGPDENFKHGFIMGTAADIPLRIGFCPDHVLVVKIGVGIEDLWYRTMAAGSEIGRTASGTRTYTSTAGITPISVIGEVGSEVVTAKESGDYFNINGFQVDAGAAVNGDTIPLEWYAWGSGIFPIRTVHDGGDTCNTYWQDASLDFRDLGVTKGMVLINIDNDDRVVIESIEKPYGEDKYCRLNFAVALTADIDDDDVGIIVPPEDEQLASITDMT